MPGVHAWGHSHSEISYKYVGFEVLTAVVMKSTIFWDTTPCSPLNVNRRFGGTYRLHLQGRKISSARNQRESRWQAELLSLPPAFLLIIFFHPEDGGDMLLRNVGWLSTDYTALYPRRQYSFYSIYSQYILHTVSIQYCVQTLCKLSHGTCKRDTYVIRDLKWI
jgi:hypothetical protein